MSSPAVINLLYARRRRAQAAQNEQIIADRLAYHGTSKANLASIRAVGLVPSVGSYKAEVEGNDAEAAVHLTTSRKIAKSYAGRDGVVLAIDADHHSVAHHKEDPHEEQSIVVNNRIHPEAIKRVESVALRLARFSEEWSKSQRR